MDDRTQQTLSTCESFLKRARTELGELAADQRVSEWAKVNFHKYGALLNTLQVPPTLHLARDRFAQKLGVFNRRLDQLENDIGNLRADFQLNTRPSSETHGRTRTLEDTLQTLTVEYEEFVLDGKQLCEAHNRLHKNLSVEALIPLARSISGKTPAFDLGYQLYNFVSDHNDGKGDTKGISYYFGEATKLDSLFANITQPGIPGLAATVVSEKIKAARKATADIKNCLDIFSENLELELNHLKTLKERLHQQRETPLTELLKAVDNETESLYRCILRFHYKAYTMDKIYAIDELLELLRFLQRTIKNELAEKLKSATTEPGSPLNPTYAATKAAESFLHGARGFWRGIRLLLALLTGQQGFNLLVFQKTLQEAVDSCDTFYGNTPADVANIENFIADRLKDYTKPFPYNDLYAITKKFLHDYGTAVELFCLRIKITVSDQANKGRTTVPLDKTFQQIQKILEKILT